MADHADLSPDEQPNTNASPTSGEEPQVAEPVVVNPNDEVEQPDGRPALGFPVVAIGASAGGVEAYLELFEKLPSNTGMAFIVVAHLARDQKSRLPEILARQTSLPVSEIRGGERPQPNQVYVAPPQARISLQDGAFHIDPDPASISSHPIDAFFHSLADAQKNRAVGVVLSGMDADGALGLKAIKAEGGIAMVQAPESAKFPAMPRSSISADHVDIIATPGKIGTELGRLGSQFQNPELRRLEDEPPTHEDDQPYIRILNLLRLVGGINFRLYKPSTVRRRIARRMLMLHIDRLSDYVSVLQGNPKELRDLHEDTLINVTRFFRDPEAFDALKAQVLPEIFEGRDPSQQVRVWVAGCSSGEEVYSIAISILEYLTGSPVEPAIQIFGTDASEQNIEKARSAIYPETVASEVSPERLRRFFTKTEKGYSISKRVRDMCIFARQNLCYDPPFSRLDLISCRNVLIYFGAELQKQLLPMFHYALRPNGYLLLGSSETIREFSELFSTVDRKQKIYTRSSAGNFRLFLDTVGPRLVPADAAANALAHSGGASEAWSDLELQRAVDRIILARYSPAAIVVNDRLQILQTRGNTHAFLQMSQGAASLHLGRMAQEEIAPQLVAAARRAIDEELPVQVDGLRVGLGEQEIDIDVEIIPIHSIGPRARVYLILFTPVQRLSEAQSDGSPAVPLLPGGDERLIGRLRGDLSSTKLYLQSLIEERDGKNQELVSANEEIQSANEELQSTNEELETTKEELQSSNEELQTVNDELQNRNAILTQARNDLANLLNSVNLPVLMLTDALHIRHFTPPTQRVMNLRSSDVGRPLGEIRMNLEIDDLEPLFIDVLESLTPREMEVRDNEGHWYLLRVRPYRTTDNKIDGLVVVLVDIDQLRRSRQELRDARDFARSIVKGIPLPLVVLDGSFKIRFTNEAFGKLANSSPNQLEGRLFPDVAFALWGMEEILRSNLTQLGGGAEQGSFAFEHQGTQNRTLAVRGCVLQPDGERFMLVTVEDITTHREGERLVQMERERLTQEVQTTTVTLRRTQDDLRSLAASLLNSQEEERRRIARDLHDDLSQRLAALEIDATAIVQGDSVDATELRSKLVPIRKELTQLSQDVRQLSHRLHPSVIEDLGLATALRFLVEEFGRREEMIASFTEENAPSEIPISVATNLYRIAQQALRNVSEHAGKTHVKVILKQEGEGIQLQVLDFGAGFEPGKHPKGLGLVAMEERARLIGGAMRVESNPGQGTKIIVDAPLTAAE